MMTFKPEKSNFLQNLFFFVLILLIFAGSVLRSAEDVLTKSLMMIIILGALLYTAYISIFLHTLQYRIGEKHITIGTGFKFTDERVSMEEIVYCTQRITLINQSGWTGLFSKRFSVGEGYIEGIGKVKMYITSSKKAIYFGTEKGNYAISPENPEAFMEELRKRHVREGFRVREVLEKDLQESENKMRKIFVFNSILILLLVEVPIVLFYLHFLPPFIAVGRLNADILSYIPARVYVDRMILYALMNFALSVGTFILARMYSRVDRVYYYRVMAFPVAVTFFLILSLASTIIAIFV